MNKIKKINMLWLALCAVALTAAGQVPEAHSTICCSVPA